MGKKSKRDKIIKSSDNLTPEEQEEIDKSLELIDKITQEVTSNISNNIQIPNLNRNKPVFPTECLACKERLYN